MLEDVWLVTGASKGLGLGFATQLAKDGNTVIGLARESNELRLAGQNLAKISDSSYVIACDMGIDDSVTAAASQILESVSSIAGIIHNAGQIGPVMSMENVDQKQWENLIKVNLSSVQSLTNKLMPIMKHEKQTRITTISSGASLRSIEAWSAYCVSKAGLDMWTKCMAEEGSKYNISAIAFAPGIVDTGMQEDIRSANPDDFPAHQNFVDYHRNGDLTDAQATANKMIPLITTHSMSQSGERFDIRNI